MTDMQKTAEARLAAAIKSDGALQALTKTVQTGRGTWKSAEDYAVRLGELLGSILKAQYPADSGTEGPELVAPLMIQCAELVAETAQRVTVDANRQAGIALRAIRYEPSQQRARNLAKKLAGYADPADGLWLLGEPIVSYMLHVVDETVRINAEAQAAAGLSPVVRRVSDSQTCPFCNAHAGDYKPPLRYQVFERHERCRCLIELIPGKAAKRSTGINSNTQKRSDRIARVLEAERRLGL